MTKYFILFYLLLFLVSCSTTKIFYNYGDFIVVWQVDNYFDLTSEQEKWIEDKMILHLEWHRKEELPKYKNFLIDIQKRSTDGISMGELNEAFSRYEAKRDRVFERLTPDVALFLTKISPYQINYLEKKIAQDNEDMQENFESPQEQLKERRKKFFEQMEDWFGELSEDQITKLNDWQKEWDNDSHYSSIDRIQSRLKSQSQFLSLLRTNSDSIYLEKWLRKWTIDTTSNSNPKRKKRILRNKRRVLMVDEILTPEQRNHASKELDYWIEVLEQIIEEN